MEQKAWKDIFRKLEMTEETKWQVWGNIIEKGADRKGAGIKIFSQRRWVAVAVVFSLFLGIAVFHVRTEGRFAEVLQRIWKMDKSSQKVAEQTVSYRFHTLDAPDLIDCSEQRLIFASAMGLIVYDRVQERVTGTIDLKEIGCFYLADEAEKSVITRFLPEGDHLTIYNHQMDGKKQENCYIYNLAECSASKDGEVKALKHRETMPVTGSLEKSWKRKVVSARRKTVENAIFDDAMNRLIKKERTFFYSRHTISWSGEKGKQYDSCLVAEMLSKAADQPGKDEYRFVLYSIDRDTEELEKEMLEFQAYLPESKCGPLPAYECRSDDAVRNALADCAKDDLITFYGCRFGVGKMADKEDFPSKDMPVLPIISIYQIKKGKKYTKVYGDFTTLELVRYGDTLCEVNSDGAGGYGCAYLKETADGYRVEKIVHPRDGAYLVKDMQAMCSGNEKLYKKVSQKHEKGWELRKQEIIKTVKEYVSVNALDARYYKGEGENPVELDSWE